MLLRSLCSLLLLLLPVSSSTTTDAECPEWRQCGIGKNIKCCEPYQECWKEWFDYTCHNKTESQPNILLVTLQSLFSDHASPSGKYSGSVKELGISFSSTVRVDAGNNADMTIAATGLLHFNIHCPKVSFSIGSRGILHVGKEGDCLHHGLSEQGIALKSVRYNGDTDKLTVVADKLGLDVVLVLSKNRVSDLVSENACCKKEDPGWDCVGMPCPGRSCGKDKRCTWDSYKCMQAGEGGGVSPSVCCKNDACYQGGSSYGQCCPDDRPVCDQMGGGTCYKPRFKLNRH